jgi:hypothetical protein
MMIKSILTFFAVSGFYFATASESGIHAVNFSASPGVSKVDLSWTTPANEEVVSYVVERSKDGELWGEIMTVSSVATSQTAETYMESDYSPIKGVSYYRLKKVLNTGMYVYSNIAVVKNHYDSAR